MRIYITHNISLLFGFEDQIARARNCEKASGTNAFNDNNMNDEKFNKWETALQYNPVNPSSLPQACPPP